ncbi:MAG: exosortase [Pseudomonadota bacterium]
MQTPALAAPGGPAPTWASAWPVVAGLLAVLGPSIYGLATGLWLSDDQSHGMIVMAVLAWMLWTERQLFTLPARPLPGPGWALLGLGVLLYVVGRSQDILLFEVGAFMPLLAGAVLLLYGTALLRRLGFFFVFLLFLLPLPGSVADALTTPLKHQVSALSASLLYAAGYPIAKAGIILHLGPYQLLVADACSGMRSMFSLAATAIMYLYLTGRRHRLHLGLLLLSILPIAFLANTLRVVTLALITFYLGDAAAQSYLHELASVSLYLFALGLLIGLDYLLGALPGLRAVRSAANPGPRP